MGINLSGVERLTAVCVYSGAGDGLTRSSHRSHRRHVVASSSSSPTSSAVSCGTPARSSAADAAATAVGRCAGSTSPPDPSRRSRSRGSSCSGSYRLLAYLLTYVSM